MPRIRSKNYTDSDKNVLLNLIKPYIDIIECSETTKEKNERKDEAWENIAVNYNAQRKIPRDAKGLRTCYQQLKMFAKKENASLQRKKLTSSGNTELDQISAKLLSIIGSTLENTNDSDSDYQNDDSSQFSSVPNDSLLDESSSLNCINIPEDTTQYCEIPGTKETNKTNVTIKREAPPPNEIAAVYVPAKKICFDDSIKAEKDLNTLKRENILKQNELLDKQIETAVLQRDAAKVQKEAAQLDFLIKQKQVEYENERLKQLKQQNFGP